MKKRKRQKVNYRTLYQLLQKKGSVFVQYVQGFSMYDGIVIVRW